MFKTGWCRNPAPCKHPRPHSCAAMPVPTSVSPDSGPMIGRSGTRVRLCRPMRKAGPLRNGRVCEFERSSAASNSVDLLLPEHSGSLGDDFTTNVRMRDQYISNALPRPRRLAVETCAHQPADRHFAHLSINSRESRLSDVSSAGSRLPASTNSCLGVKRA